MFTAMPGDRARTVLQGTRFGDVRWVAETGSTNADALALAHQGDPEGIVLVADHQTAGRGRHGRTWEAPAKVCKAVTSRAVLVWPSTSKSPQTSILWPWRMWS